MWRFLALVSLVACSGVARDSDPDADGTGVTDISSCATNRWPHLSEVGSPTVGGGWNVGDSLPDVRTQDQFDEETCLGQFRGGALLLVATWMFDSDCEDFACRIAHAGEGFPDTDLNIVYLLTTEMGDEPLDSAHAATYADGYGIPGPVLPLPAEHLRAVTPDGGPIRVFTAGRDQVVRWSTGGPGVDVCPSDEDALRAAVVDAVGYDPGPVGPATCP
jgi:hypothetical protein